MFFFLICMCVHINQLKPTDCDGHAHAENRIRCPFLLVHFLHTIFTVRVVFWCKVRLNLVDISLRYKAIVTLDLPETERGAVNSTVPAWLATRQV